MMRQHELDPEPLIGDQGRQIAEALGTLSSGLSRFPSEDEAIARIRGSILNIEIAAIREALRLRFSAARQ